MNYSRYTIYIINLINLSCDRVLGEGLYYLYYNDLHFVYYNIIHVLTGFSVLAPKHIIGVWDAPPRYYYYVTGDHVGILRV